MRRAADAMRYFVTGATGFIGGHLVRQLIDAGHEVDIIARDPGKAGELAQIGVRVHRGDITEIESMRAPMAGTGGGVHLAGWDKIGERGKSPGPRGNVDGTRNLLRLMEELGSPEGRDTRTPGVLRG